MSAPVQRGRSAIRRSIAWYLRQWSRILNVLSDEELDRLIPLLSERSFRPRQQLFSTGEAPDRVYLLLKGRVKVYQVAENGKEIILDVVTKGGIVGDMAIVENGERTACAQAIDDTVAVTISWEDFTFFLQQSPRLGFAMVELMARRLTGMQRQMMSLVSKPVSARLADFLIAREDEGIVALGLTHAELAQSIGTSRESVTALLSRFVTLGALEQRPGGYRISSPAILASIASGEIAVSPRHPVPAQRAATG
jgi:CRP/FNR family transcriptional regulator, cyclic AMP receptor protein